MTTSRGSELPISGGTEADDERTRDSDRQNRRASQYQIVRHWRARWKRPTSALIRNRREEMMRAPGRRQGIGTQRRREACRKALDVARSNPLSCDDRDSVQETRSGENNSNKNRIRSRRTRKRDRSRDCRSQSYRPYREADRPVSEWQRESKGAGTRRLSRVWSTIIDPW